MTMCSIPITMDGGGGDEQWRKAGNLMGDMNGGVITMGDGGGGAIAIAMDGGGGDGQWQRAGNLM
jgi:hypothetical protein